MTVEELKTELTGALPGAKIAVRDLTGTQDHYEAIIGWSEFQGKSLIQQHQLVYQALGARVGGEIHALKLKTCTPDDFDAALASAGPQ